MTRISAISAAAIGLAMASAEQAGGRDILAGGDDDVGKRLRARVDERPRASLAGMGKQAAPPPSRKLPTCQAGSPPSMIAIERSAPPTGRMTEWIASHRLSTQAILSAKNSASGAERRRCR